MKQNTTRVQLDFSPDGALWEIDGIEGILDLSSPRGKREWGGVCIPQLPLSWPEGSFRD